MSEFISKLQYKTYEKGEFSGEKPRGLEETLQLIKDFPWDEQRGVDVQLTGPSVTIQDEYVNYLKVGLYFNGKFSLYYLDHDNHLYEYHTDDLNDVCKQVTDFFSQQLDLGQFDKHVFSIGSKHHFENGAFDYGLSKRLVFSYAITVGFLLCVVSFANASLFKVRDMPILVILLLIFLDIIFYAGSYYLIKIFIKTKDMCIYISKGKNEFQFWKNDVLSEYKKENVARLDIYGQTGRSSRIFNLMEIIFKDGSNLIVPGTLVDPFTLISKLPGVPTKFKGGYFLTSKIFWSFTQ